MREPASHALIHSRSRGHGNDLLRNFGTVRARMRIRVHKTSQSPVAARRAAVPGAGDLIDRLEHNGGARCARDFGRVIGGLLSHTIISKSSRAVRTPLAAI